MPTYFENIRQGVVTIFAPRPGELHEDDAKLATDDDVLGLDTEFRAFRSHQDVVADSGAAGLRLIQFATRTHALVLDPRAPEHRAFAKAILTSGRTFVVHNAGAEAKATYFGLGLDITRCLHDTYIDALLLDPGINGEEYERGRHGLKPLCAARGLPELARLSAELDEKFNTLYGHVSGKGEEVRAHGWDTIPAGEPIYARYAGMDAVAVRRLAPLLEAELLAVGEELRDRSRVEQRLAQVARRIELRGWRVDPRFGEQLLATEGTRNAEAKAAFEDGRYTWVDAKDKEQTLKIQSPKRVDWLEARGVKFQEHTKSGAPSLGKSELARLVSVHTDDEASEFLALCHQFSSTQNVTTMTKNVLSFAGERDRVHASIGTLNATTGRFSVTNPGLQTVSWRNPVRGLFVPDAEDHVLVSADLAQVEPKIYAVLAGEQHLIDQANAGVDIYAAVAAAVGNRKVAKRIVLGRAYGSGVRTMTDQIRTMDGLDISEDEVRAAVQAVDAAYPGFKAFSREVQEYDPVWLPSGRFVPVDPDRLYKNVNSVVQGAARDLFSACMLALYDAGLGGAMLMPIHDEVMLSLAKDSLDEALPIVRHCMSQDFMGLKMSTEIEIYPDRWSGKGEVWGG
jgi:DNA polymerase-1